MPTIPIQMPQLGESIAEATIVRILIEPGQQIEAGTDIFEVETNKATMAVSSPCAGHVSVITAQVQKSYAVGTNLAAFDVSDGDALALGFNEPTEPINTTQASNTASAARSAIRSNTWPASLSNTMSCGS